MKSRLIMVHLTVEPMRLVPHLSSPGLPLGSVTSQFGQWLPSLVLIMAPLAWLSSLPPVQHWLLCPWFLDYSDVLLSGLGRTTWFLEEPLSLKPRTRPHHEVMEAHTIGTAHALRKRTQKSQWKMIKKPLETGCGGSAGSLNFISPLRKSASE